MTGTWQSLSQKQQAVVQRLFDAQLTLRSLQADSTPPHVEAQGFSFAELFAFVTSAKATGNDPEFEALPLDSRQMAEVQRLLSKHSHYYAPRLAAASSGAISHREGTGFSIDLKASRAEPSQTYVIIALDSRAGDVPSTLFVSRHEKRLIKHVLPTPRGSTIQLLVDSQSELIESLGDPECEVFLR